LVEKKVVRMILNILKEKKNKAAPLSKRTRPSTSKEGENKKKRWEGTSLGCHRFVERKGLDWAHSQKSGLNDKVRERGEEWGKRRENH